MVKRYEFWNSFGKVTPNDGELSKAGEFVSHDDYAALEAQVRHLEVYPGRCERLEIENAALRYRLSKLEREK